MIATAIQEIYQNKKQAVAVSNVYHRRDIGRPLYCRPVGVAMSGGWSILFEDFPLAPLFRRWHLSALVMNLKMSKPGGGSMRTLVMIVLLTP